jgi:hypothetical protein
VNDHEMAQNGGYETMTTMHSRVSRLGMTAW